MRRWLGLVGSRRRSACEPNGPETGVQPVDRVVSWLTSRRYRRRRKLVNKAVELARLVVEGRLAAGAQIVGPVISAFWHEGEFGAGEEWQLLLKTRADR
ncbi:divalent cation tolerance protein CutA [Streptomyces sp. NPDC002896]|uniref:divalent cation tolerance protein CutA n=1 Tax=Streptomyces sp. NPDC002896 TaxID=3154438 RepID=UPI0033170C84